MDGIHNVDDVRYIARRDVAGAAVMGFARSPYAHGRATDLGSATSQSEIRMMPGVLKAVRPGRAVVRSLVPKPSDAIPRSAGNLAASADAKIKVRASGKPTSFYVSG